MPTTLNKPAYQQLFDEDLRWLRNNSRTLERDHIEQCLLWMRENKEAVEDYTALQARAAAAEAEVERLRGLISTAAHAMRPRGYQAMLQQTMLVALAPKAEAGR